MSLRKIFHNIGLSSFISLILLLCFTAIAISLVFSKGVCCADDAYLSVIAKNLANGLGYSSTIQPFVSRFTIRAYDPLVGTGPTLILPASLFIKLFGNTFWAPGLANVTLWSLLFICIGFLLQKYNNGIGLIFFTFSFLYLAYSLMTYHFAHWYALLGEVPAALLILIGVLCFLYRETRLNQVFTGIIFSLAVQAKILTLVAFMVFIVAHIFLYLGSDSDGFSIFVRKSANRIFYIILGFFIPFLMFEMWKFFVMGHFDYMENWHDFLKYAGDDGARLDQSLSLLELYKERSEVLLERFGLLLPNTGLIVMLAWLMIQRDRKLRTLFLVIVSIVISYSFWWLFLSIGWPRYFIICLILLIFLISLPLLSARPKLYVFLYLVLIIFFSSNNWARLNYPFEELNGKYFLPTPRTQSLISVSKMLSRNISRNDGRIATQWWGTAADIEYMMDTSLNFTTFRDGALMKKDSFWIAVNTKFLSKNDKEFVDLLEGCVKIQEKSVYIIAYCEVKVSE